MKRNKFLLFGIVSIILFAFSCKKDNNNNTTIKKYSGVIVGSTGAYSLSISGTGASANIVFDSVTYNLTTNEVLENGQSLTLTDGTISLVITVDSNGENPTISFTIPGHNIQATIVLSNTTNPNQNFIGWTENFRNGVRVYRTTFNLTLHNSNQWTGIEKIDVDINPSDPNHTSSEGQITQVTGAYTEDTNGVSFFFSNGSSIFTLNKVGNKLTLFESGTTTFEAELTKVN